MSNEFAVLGWEDNLGVMHADTVETSYLPSRTREKIILMSTRKGAGQEIAGIELFFSENDFAHCEVNFVDGTFKTAFVITKNCPLFGKTCDGDMKSTLISCVSCWQMGSKVWKFKFLSESLIVPLNSPGLDPCLLGKLCARGRIPGNQKILTDALTDKSSRRPYGNRPISYTGARALLQGISNQPELEGDSAVALRYIRAALGCTQTNIGKFYKCLQQSNTPWINIIQCCCHLVLPSDSDIEGLQPGKTRCLYKSTERTKRLAANKAGAKTKKQKK